MSVPALRFKGEDGHDYPAWISKSIGDVLTIGSGRDYKHLALGNIPVYGTGGYMLAVDDYLYDGESVCIGRKGTIDKPTLLNGKFWTVDTLFYTHSFKDCLPKFVHACFQRIDWKSHNEASGVPSLSKSTIEKIDIHVPTVEEQTRIASFLTAVDEKITQLTQKYELLHQYKKGVMQQVFSQALRFKDDDGQDFPEWRTFKLNEIANIIGGGTPDTAVTINWQGGIQWFTPTELKSKYVSRSLRTITEQGLKASSAKLLPAGTLLLSSRATVGDVSIALNECTTNQGFQSLIVNEKNDNEFIYYWLLNNKNALLEKASGSTFLEISKREIEKLLIQRPSKAEQTKIAKFFIVIDDKLSYTQAQLTAAKQYKQGLLQQMFV